MWTTLRRNKYIFPLETEGKKIIAQAGSKTSFSDKFGIHTNILKYSEKINHFSNHCLQNSMVRSFFLIYIWHINYICEFFLNILEIIFSLSLLIVVRNILNNSQQCWTKSRWEIITWSLVMEKWRGGHHWARKAEYYHF